MPFHPDGILFSPTARCNLSCPHCNVTRSKACLSVKFAERFLIDCKEHSIDRVGFTGGEPFLATDFLYAVTRFAVSRGFLFTEIVTNGVWYRDARELKNTLQKLFEAGYDGNIFLSVDDYHKQGIAKLKRFITTAYSVWRRPDIISILYVTGRDAATKLKLTKLAGALNGRLTGFDGTHPVIKSAGIHSSRAGLNLPYHIKIEKIALSPIGKAARLKNAWDGIWFKEDHCKGPGNVLFVEPSGDVKPCCGYASGSKALYVGNIKRDTVFAILKNIRQNRIVCAIFDSGLAGIRRKLIDRGIRFPGKTSNNCFFCHYILTKVPRSELLKSLKTAGL